MNTKGECPKLINCVPKFSHEESKRKQTSPELSKSKIRSKIFGLQD